MGVFMEEWWDTTILCELFNVNGAANYLVDATPVHIHNYIGGMSGHKHSDKTKKKMRQSKLGVRMFTLHRGGKIMKDGVVREFDCLSDICKELNLSTGHLSEVMSGKRRSVKGWVRA